MANIIASIKIGTRRSAGTDWPVYHQLAKIGRAQWQITKDLCNGTAEGSETYTTRKSAFATLSNLARTAEHQLEIHLAEDRIDDAHRGDVETYDLAPGTVLLQPILGNPDSEEEDYYSGRTAVAWDAAASDQGAGACTVEDGELSTWLHLRWPAPQGTGHGWLADGTFA